MHVRLTSRRIVLGLSPAALVAVVVLLLAAPASAPAAIVTVGSPLYGPATLNTAENLNYQGVNTAVPPTPQDPNGIVHTAHFGADTALWNIATAIGAAAMPAGGEAVQIELEGCAVPAPGGPAPITQIHFQDLSPLPNGGARVNISSGAFDIPVCGQGGASASTISTYRPFNLCVRRGDYVALNDEGGFAEGFYRAGVPYQVLGANPLAQADSFIRGNGTGNGAVLSATDTTAMDGFAANVGEELTMRVQLGTGPDARYVCPGGSKEAPPVLPVIRVRPQTDGVNHQRIVSVAIYCRPSSGCRGTAVLTLPGASSSASVGKTSFNLPGNKTSHLPIRVSSRLMGLIRRRHGVATTLVAAVGGQTFSQTVTVKIF
jgi:hypothetical protein